MAALVVARWTGDLELFQELRPAVERALHWIDKYGDVAGDGRFFGYDQRFAHRKSRTFTTGSAQLQPHVYRPGRKWLKPGAKSKDPHPGRIDSLANR